MPPAASFFKEGSIRGNLIISKGNGVFGVFCAPETPFLYKKGKINFEKEKNNEKRI